MKLQTPTKRSAWTDLAEGALYCGFLIVATIFLIAFWPFVAYKWMTNTYGEPRIQSTCATLCSIGIVSGLATVVSLLAGLPALLTYIALGVYIFGAIACAVLVITLTTRT